MRQLIKVILLIITPFALTAETRAQSVFANIKDYRVFYARISKAGKDWIALREFSNIGKSYYFLVDPNTLKTYIDESRNYSAVQMSWDAIKGHFKSTPYMRAIATAEKRANTLQNAGITTGMRELAGMSVTGDLCPSHRPLDRSIFNVLIAAFQKVEQPVPIGLSLSGVWMQQHPADLEWLKQLDASKQISITWINHSYNHRVSPTAPLRKNFLLEPGTDINYEVLETEKAMLKNGLLPSVFFRFPGLVSNRQLLRKITGFGLIPIGSDAWLAKGQQVKPGSIVLIHANGNEPVGVKDLIRLLQQNTDAITKKKWLLYDLTESVSGEFEKGD